ncbi:hypothetical protein GW17_00033391, partial [Ensete ventricosum]
HPPPFISSTAQPPSPSSYNRILLLPPSQVEAVAPIFLSSPLLADAGNLVVAKSHYIYDICP